MRELLTPVQYEPALDMLNQINKLTISNKASLSLDAMQVCKNPVGHGNPIIGKFCREDMNGALCCNKEYKSFETYEYAYYQIPVDVWGVTHTFAQKVGGVLVKSFAQRPLDYDVQWETANGGRIKILKQLTFEWLPFEGETIYIFGSIIQAFFRVWLYGFY